MAAMRVMAGHDKQKGLHFNPRTVCEPPEELQQLIFPFVEQCMAAVERAAEQDKQDRFTAVMFLRLLKNLRRIILQDAAVMTLDYNRKRHPVFKHAVFQTEEFAQFQTKMQQHLEALENPVDRSIESLLPGLLQRMSNQQADITHCRREIKELLSLQTVIAEQILARMAGTEERIGNRLQDVLLHALRGAAGALSGQSLQQLHLPRVEQQFTAQQGSGTNMTARITMPGASTASAVDNSQPKSPLDVEDHILTRGHTSVRSMYNEWHGLDEYKDVPVVGGIETLETVRKTAWRREYVQSEQQYFSRFKRVIVAIRNRSGGADPVPVEVFNELDTLFEEAGSLSSLVSKLQSLGYLNAARRAAATATA
jgi:hypothetical protein